jgi:hypothetical protein
MKTKDESKKFHPTEEQVSAARMALRTEAGETFWQEVSERLDEYKPKIEARPVRK